MPYRGRRRSGKLDCWWASVEEEKEEEACYGEKNKAGHKNFSEIGRKKFERKEQRKRTEDLQNSFQT
jgi:hypothetical protein